MSQARKEATRRTTRRPPRVLAAAVGMAVLALVSACAGRPVEDAAFWQDFQVRALEVNPPATLADLAGRAQVIATGKVRSVEAGPSATAQEGPIMTTVALVVRATSVLKGSLAGKVVLVLIAPAGPMDVSAKAKPSGNQVMVFLVPATQPGYYGCVSIAGLVEDTPHGVETVADPTQSGLVTAGQGNDRKSFNQLVQEVRALVG